MKSKMRIPSTPCTLVLLSWLLLCAPGCKVRTFGDGASSDTFDTEGTPTASGASVVLGSEPPRHYASALFVGGVASTTDLIRHGRFDSQTLQSDAVHTLDATEKPIILRSGTRMPKELALLLKPFDVAAFEKTLSSRPSDADLSIVTAVMRDNLAEFSQIGAEGRPNPKPNAFGFAATLAATAGSDFSNDTQGVFTLSDPRRPFSKTYCVGNTRAHMSDLKFHYTCQIPAAWRACYRTVVGFSFDLEVPTLIAQAAKDGLDHQTLEAGLREIAERDHKRTLAFCTEGGDVAGLPAEVLKAYESQADSAELDLPLYRKLFTAFHAAQERTLPSGAKINVFDFVMRSATFDFGYAAQQAALNAFYGSLRPGGAPLRADETDACNELRGPRPSDAEEGRHCDPTAPKRFGLYSNGR